MFRRIFRHRRSSDGDSYAECTSLTDYTCFTIPEDGVAEDPQQDEEEKSSRGKNNKKKETADQMQENNTNAGVTGEPLGLDLCLDYSPTWTCLQSLIEDQVCGSIDECGGVPVPFVYSPRERKSQAKDVVKGLQEEGVLEDVVAEMQRRGLVGPIVKKKNRFHLLPRGKAVAQADGARVPSFSEAKGSICDTGGEKVENKKTAAEPGPEATHIERMQALLAISSDSHDPQDTTTETASLSIRPLPAFDRVSSSGGGATKRQFSMFRIMCCTGPRNRKGAPAAWDGNKNEWNHYGPVPWTIQKETDARDVQSLITFDDGQVTTSRQALHREWSEPKEDDGREQETEGEWWATASVLEMEQKRAAVPYATFSPTTSLPDASLEESGSYRQGGSSLGNNSYSNNKNNNENVKNNQRDEAEEAQCKVQLADKSMLQQLPQRVAEAFICVDFPEANSCSASGQGQSLVSEPDLSVTTGPGLNSYSKEEHESLGDDSYRIRILHELQEENRASGNELTGNLVDTFEELPVEQKRSFIQHVARVGSMKSNSSSVPWDERTMNGTVADKHRLDSDKFPVPRVITMEPMEEPRYNSGIAQLLVDNFLSTIYPMLPITEEDTRESGSRTTKEEDSNQGGSTIGDTTADDTRTFQDDSFVNSPSLEPSVPQVTPPEVPQVRAFDEQALPAMTSSCEAPLPQVTKRWVPKDKTSRRLQFGDQSSATKESAPRRPAQPVSTGMDLGEPVATENLGNHSLCESDSSSSYQTNRPAARVRAPDPDGLKMGN